jgi:hypothetical protein
MKAAIRALSQNRAQRIRGTRCDLQIDNYAGRPVAAVNKITAANGGGYEYALRLAAAGREFTLPRHAALSLAVTAHATAFNRGVNTSRSLTTVPLWQP